jgi:hypothetical protein
MRLLTKLWPFLLVLPLAFYASVPQLWRCQAVGRSADFVRFAIDSTVLFVSRDTPTRVRQALPEQVRQARARIRAFWGGQQGRAILIYCHQPDQFAGYCAGGEGAGCSLGTPWGQSFLVLGPDGRDVDVMAHELCHDELFVRLGWWTVKRTVPQWFNEGLALMVDYRFTDPAHPRQRYNDYFDELRFRSIGRVSKRQLDDLETTRDFFGGDSQAVMLAYMTAGREVSGWLARNGPAAPQRLTRSMQTGSDFSMAYQPSIQSK